jgi:hypothetical protein
LQRSLFGGRQVRVQHREKVIHPRQKLGVVARDVSCCHLYTSTKQFEMEEAFPADATVPDESVSIIDGSGFTLLGVQASSPLPP